MVACNEHKAGVSPAFCDSGKIAEQLAAPHCSAVWFNLEYHTISQKLLCVSCSFLCRPENGFKWYHFLIHMKNYGRGEFLWWEIIFFPFMMVPDPHSQKKGRGNFFPSSFLQVAAPYSQDKKRGGRSLFLEIPLPLLLATVFQAVLCTPFKV